MKINKNLKHATFEWDDETKEFTIDTRNQIGGNVVTLNKVYSFAFMRFVVRMAQRNWLRGLSKKAGKESENLSTDLLEDPNQIKFCYDLEEESSN